MLENKNCGCKGIRTCLVCEKKSDILAKSLGAKENLYIYNYCSHCNLCWPNDEAAASFCNYPLYLGKIKLVPEFCSKEEESTIISFIDKIPWKPSQSGRRKQDFGPKVNFKKKKVKIGEFKGFPKFTESIIKKFQGLPELSDFDPVELCNLEYTPERGSSIDPHVDDFWLWGERLLTVNLNSTTVLTLVPCSEVVCDCLQTESSSSFQPSSNHGDETISCQHLFENGNPIKHSFNCSSKNNITACKLRSLNSELSKDFSEKLEFSNNPAKAEKNSTSPTTYKVNTEETNYSVIYCNSDTATKSLNCFKISDTSTNEKEVIKMNHHDCRTTTERKITSETKTTYTNCKVTDSKIKSVCNIFRTYSSGSKICIRIVLPPRSLFVLAGCARYNWFHEIKRQDVISRRLAMTFRELSAKFLDENEEYQSGKHLLKIANNFYDL